MIKLHGSQSQFLTPELMNNAITLFLNQNPELVIKAVSDYLNQNPELLEINEMKATIQDILLGQAHDRSRIRTIEVILGIVEDEEVYEEKIQEYKQIFSNSILAKIETVDAKKEIENLVYDELGKRSSMHNKDILSFLGWNSRNTIKATRLMRSMAEKYSDVECINVPGKKRALRIYRKIKHRH